MSTTATLTVKHSDGSFHSTYVNFDGYLSGVGQTLEDHYNNQEAAEAVVSLGQIRDLGSTIAKTDFYGRDQGETGCETIIADTKEKAEINHSHCIHYYWDADANGVWIVNGDEEFSLAEVIQNEKEYYGED